MKIIENADQNIGLESRKSFFGPSPYVVIKSVPEKRALNLDRFQHEFHTISWEKLESIFVYGQSNEKSWLDN